MTPFEQIAAASGASAQPAARRLRPMAARCALAVVLLFSLDALLFRTGFYASILDPESSTGHFELTLQNELHRKASGQPEILALGDSRMMLSASAANDLSPGAGYFFARAAVAGSTPRCWYYFLKDLDPDARRYDAVILPLENYLDQEPSEDLRDRTLDVRYLAVRLRLRDVLDFSSSFESLQSRFYAFRGGLFKGFTYQQDLQGLLAHPLARLAKVDYHRRESAFWFYTYLPPDRNVKGLAVDWAAGRITFPEGLSPAERQQLQDDLLKPPEGAGWYAAYRRQWFGRIIDRYKGSHTRVVFIRLPRGPVVRPASPGANAASTVREFASLPNVVVCDEHLFDELERPELFSDALHLNREGSIRFSRTLAALMPQVLGRAAAAAP